VGRGLRRDAGSGHPHRTTAAASLAVLALALGLAVPAAADTKDDLQQQQQEYARQREQVAAALEGTNAALSQTYLELQDIEARLPQAQAELDAANVTLAAKEREARAIADRLAVAEQQQATLEQEIAAGQADEAKVRQAVGQLARSTYRDGVDLSTLAVVLDATSPEEFADRYSAMDAARRTQSTALNDLEASIAVQRNAQARLDAVQERIVELKAEADAAVVAAEAARDAAAARQREMQSLRDQAAAKAATLESQRRQFQSQQAQIEAADRAVAAQIQAIARAEAAERERQRRLAAERAAREAAARAAQSQGGGSSSGSSGGGSSGGGSSARVSSSSSIGPPIAGGLYVTSAFGYRLYPITGGWFMHNGVDLRAACGKPQIASNDGTVIGVRGAAGNGTHGNQVLINHGVVDGRSTVTVYNHLSRFAVSSGQRVSRGQVIGYTGSTGATTGCHVHFELWLNGTPVNPMNYL
jgi:murein DD-endopeptidase MepM/ murein hydrolase activator NlpD